MAAPQAVSLLYTTPLEGKQALFVIPFLLPDSVSSWANCRGWCTPLQKHSPGSGSSEAGDELWGLFASSDLSQPAPRH